MTIPKRVGILGGGITGLSTAYYLIKQFGEHVRPIIFERSKECGGWIRTITRTDGSDITNYEIGPRTIRPAGFSGMNTLDLVEELDLSGQVMFVKKDHPAAKTRFIYKDGNMVKLPQDMSALWKKTPPFDRPLLYAGIRDIFKLRLVRSKRAEDDSIYNFVQRRFGSDMALYVIDPLIRGICAGDARKISVKFLMKTLFEYEQKYGSVCLGFLLSRLKKAPELLEMDKTSGYSNIALTSVATNWAVWTLENGLKTLPWKIHDYLQGWSNFELVHGEVKGLKVHDTFCEIENDDNTVKVDHVISAIPAKDLGRILRHSKHSSLWKVFDTMECIDVQVTNLLFRKPVLTHTAFGFLVPSVEKSVEGLLGVVFDTCSFPQSDKTILTVMTNPTFRHNNIDQILDYLKVTLNIEARPDDYYTELLKNCIPQYTVGHYEKVDAARRYIKAAKLPLTLAGASYDGVSVNDCIYSGRKAASAFDLDL